MCISRRKAFNATKGYLERGVVHNMHGGKKGDGGSVICRNAVPSVRGMVSATFYSKRFMVSRREICPPRCYHVASRRVGTKSRKCRKAFHFVRSITADFSRKVDRDRR